MWRRSELASGGRRMRVCGPCQLIERRRVVDKCIRRRNVSQHDDDDDVDNNLQCLVRRAATTRSLTDELSDPTRKHRAMAKYGSVQSNVFLSPGSSRIRSCVVNYHQRHQPHQQQQQQPQWSRCNVPDVLHVWNNNVSFYHIFHIRGINYSNAQLVRRHLGV